MGVLLEELLAEPALGLELVAGAEGLRTRGEVRWAHISEIPDPTPWLEGGEILLTTGLGIKESPRLQRRLVAGLAERGCTAVGFGVGVWLEEPPAALLEEADHCRLPVFTVPYEVPFIAVTMQVSRRVFARHYASLRRAVDLHRAVLSAVISGAGVEAVVHLLVRARTDLEAIVFDAFGRTLTHAGLGLDGTEHLWNALAEHGGLGDRAEFRIGQRIASSAPVRLGEHIEAVLVLLTDRPLDEAGQLLMEQGVAGLSLELARGLSVRESRRAVVSDLYEEALAGRVNQAVLSSRLERLGLDPSDRYRVIAARPPPRTTEAAVCRLFEEVLTAARAVGAVGHAEGLVHAFVQPADVDLTTFLAAAGEGRGWPPFGAGRSRTQTDVDGLAVALRESAVAARHASQGVCDVGDLGLRGLLAGAQHEVAARAFVAQILGPVLEHDERESSALIDSLRAYLAHGCRPGPAAEQVHVHRHTLAYRLEQIARLTGRDPRSGEHLVAYGLALELAGRPPEAA